MIKPYQNEMGEQVAPKIPGAQRAPANLEVRSKTYSPTRIATINGMEAAKVDGPLGDDQGRLLKSEGKRKLPG